MPNANNLSPFRRKEKKFIIPSSYYKNSKRAEINIVKDSSDLIQNKKIEKSSNNFKKNIKKSNSNVKNTNLQNENNDYSNDHSKGVSRYSLSSIKIQREAKRRSNDKKASIQNLNDKFNLEMLNKQWKKYIESKHSSGENIIASLLEMVKLKLIKNNSLIIETDTEVNRNQIVNEMSSILPFLKESLNNYKIKFKVNVISQDKSESIFTIREKFDYLESINPKIKLLMDEFKIQL